MNKFFIPLLLLFCSTLLSQNAPLNPVTFTVLYSDLPNDEGMITVFAKIDPKWHIYSQRATDAGPIPTSFTVTTCSNIDLIGRMNESNAHEEFVAAFDAKVFVFEKEATFTQKIKRKNKAVCVAKVTLEFMTCNDRQCLPPKILDYQVTIPANK